MRPTLITLALVACGPWPRYADLDDDPDIVEPGQDPGALVEIAWELATEESLIDDGPNNNPANLEPLTLGMLGGVQVAGALDGVGWDSSLEPLTLRAVDCTSGGEAGPVPRDPGRPGDWTGDLDFIRFEVTPGERDPLLCARAHFGRDDIGFDLLLYELNDCGLPGAPVQLNSQVLGSDRAGPVDGWIAPVVAGRSYAVLTAGFLAPDAMGIYDYHVGLSIVPALGGGERCPYLPAEATDR